MKIIHYALGFPPYRTGGLTKYCIDLMLTQKEQGNDVSLVWPGRFKILNRKIKIYQGKNWHGIHNYEIFNPLPVALDEGVKEIEAYTTNTETSEIINFFEKQKPDIFHIHTLMGLYKEFVDIALQLGIRTVFTTHDYYGLCPKVSMFHNGKVCSYDINCKECVQCNSTALSLKKIFMMQSPFYRTLKNTYIVKKMRNKHRDTFFKENNQNIIQSNNENNSPSDYFYLRNYYISILEEIDMIHFNSSVSQSVYLKYIQPKDYCIVSLSHRDISDHRNEHKKSKGKIKFTYLGPAKPYKGFQYMLNVMDELWRKKKSFELHIYTETTERRPYITHYQDRYTYSELPEIFAKTDCLVVPSLWKETYGFTVLEASSYGIPVIVSENVGAKDILPVDYIYKNLEYKLIQIIDNGIEFKNTEKLLPLLNMKSHTDSIKEKIYFE